MSEKSGVNSLVTGIVYFIGLVIGVMIVRVLPTEILVPIVIIILGGFFLYQKFFATKKNEDEENLR